MSNTQFFNSANLSALEPDCKILNYVWINRERFVPGDNGAQCGVPLHYIDQAVKNAQLYPDSLVNIWLDQALLDDKSIEMVKARVQGVSNIRVEYLRDIPAYAQHDIFEIGREFPLPHSRSAKHIDLTNIMGRADLARLIVLKHCFEVRTADFVFYSDFDIDDTKLNSEKAQDALEVYGICLGFKRSEVQFIQHKHVENSYLAMNRSNKALSDLNKLISLTESKVFRGENGFAAIEHMYLLWMVERLGNSQDRLILPVPDPGYRMAQDKNVLIPGFGHY